MTGDLLPELQCANWRDSRNGRQVEVYGLGWTNETLDEAMSAIQWQGNCDELEEWLERRSSRRLQVTVERPIGGRGDVIYVVEPDDRSIKESDFDLELGPHTFSIDGEFGIPAERLERFVRRYMHGERPVEEGDLQSAFQEHFKLPAIVSVTPEPRAVRVRIWRPGMSHEIWSGPRPPKA